MNIVTMGGLMGRLDPKYDTSGIYKDYMLNPMGHMMILDIGLNQRDYGNIVLGR